MIALDLERLRHAVDSLITQHHAVPFRSLIATTALCREARLTVDLAAATQVGFPIVVIEREPDRAPAFFGKLTPRERDVARLIAKGHCNKEIASLLNVSVATVKDHVHSVLSKSGLSSRLEVASAFIAMDW